MAVYGSGVYGAGPYGGTLAVGPPQVQVLLDDGTGTFPYDVSAYARLDTGWSFQRGWLDDTDDGTADPGQLKVRLDNTDGRFTLGSTTYPVTVASGGTGALMKDQQLRLIEVVGGTSYVRFTGYVYDWPTVWESALGNLAYAEVVVVDRMARYNRHTLRSTVEETVLLDKPSAYYTLDEDATATSAGDTSGAGAPALYITPGPGGGQPLAFGGGVGPGNDGLTAVQLYAGNCLANGLPTTGPRTMETWFVCAVTAGHQVLIAAQGVSGNASRVTRLDGSVAPDINVLLLVINPAGKLSIQTTYAVDLATSAATVTDGLLHHAAVTYDGTTVTAYLDGAQVASTTTTVGDGTALLLGFVYTGTLAHAAVYPTALPLTQIRAHYTSGTAGFAGEPADTRVRRLTAYAGTAAAQMTLEAGSITGGISAAAVDGKSVTEALRDVGAAEGGQVFVDAMGRTVLHAHDHRPARASAAPTATFAGSDVDPTTVEFGAVDYLLNIVTAQRTSGTAQEVRNLASIARYEAYPGSFDVALLTTDTLVMDRLQWIATTQGEPMPRVPSLSFDLLSLPQATVLALLAVEIGDHIQLTASLPAQAPAGALAPLDLIVEGYREQQARSLDGTTWTLLLNTVPAVIYYGPVVDTASATVDTGRPVYF